MHLACWTFTQEMTRKYRKRPELAQSTINTRKYKLFKESITKYQKLQKSGRNYQKLQKSSSTSTRNHQQVPKRTRKYQIFPELPERASAGCNRVTLVQEGVTTQWVRLDWRPRIVNSVDPQLKDNDDLHNRSSHHLSGCFWERFFIFFPLSLWTQGLLEGLF